MRSVLHIAPRFPPQLDGVGDYAVRLATELERSYSVENIFLSADPGQQGCGKVELLSARTSRALIEKLESLEFSLILLHYSGYGFDDAGIPTWLYDGLNDYITRSAVPLATMFHEVWSSGRPWQRAFYTQRRQRDLVHKLHNLASVSVTSTPRMAEHLAEAGGTPLVLPIPSNVPGVHAHAPRPRRGGLNIAVFGLPETRLRSIEAHASTLQRLAGRSALQRLVLIGKAATEQSADFREASRIVARSEIQLVSDAPVAAIQSVLASADICLSYYAPHLLTKSSSAMAALLCACPLVLSNSSRKDVEFEPKPPFLVCDGSPESVDRLLQAREEGALEELAHDGREWCEQHASWRRTTQVFAEAFELTTPALAEAGR